jgi:flagellar biosynthesis/type III secretory pathway protein FliH
MPKVPAWMIAKEMEREANGETRRFHPCRREGVAEGYSEGRLEALRELLTLLGGRTLGKPDAVARERLAALDDPDALEARLMRLDKVESWEELLA